jgi:hypothetical protein
LVRQYGHLAQRWQVDSELFILAFRDPPGMNSLNPIDVPPDADRVSPKMAHSAGVSREALVTDGASRQICEPRQRWPDLRLRRYFDLEADRRDAPWRFRRTAASRR